MKVKVVLIHGNQTLRWNYAWFPWLKSELEKHGIEVFAETFPDSIIARKKYWIKFLEKIVKPDELTVLVGHSSGALCAMKYAENHNILGSVLVAAAYTDLGDELEKQSGYFDEPWDWHSIRNNQKWIVQLASTDDEYIPIQEAHFIKKHLNSDYIEFSDRGHFIKNQKEFPELLGALMAHLN